LKESKRLASASVPQKQRTRADSQDKICKAALETLVQEGFGGTSARAIARRGGFNQATIYYHFPDLTHLLLATIDTVSLARLEVYRTELAYISTVTELVATMTRMYQEDVASGLITAVQELVAGSSSSPTLGQELVSRMDPWVELAEDVVRRLLDGSPLAQVVPVGDVAYALVSLYFGVETLSHLDRDRSRSKELFETGARLAPLADNILEGFRG
jgi:AcrR family transcriptional regulator